MDAFNNKNNEKEQVKERPIPFSDQMVRAILYGSKTQTRRVVKPKPNSTWGDVEESKDYSGEWFYWHDGNQKSATFTCPYGKPGDRLWVRETFCSSLKNIVGYFADATCGAWVGDGAGERFWLPHGYILQAKSYHESFREPARTFSLSQYGGKWRSGRFMPRWASRITLEITGIRVERLHEISEADAIAEGSQIAVSELPKSCQQGCFSERTQFSRIWDSINGKKHPWASNPWVWVIQFKPINTSTNKSDKDAI